MKKGNTSLIVLSIIVIIVITGIVVYRQEKILEQGKEKVTIYVVDSFSRRKDSHGKMVSQMAEKFCFNSCKVEPAIAGKHSIDKEKYLSELAKIVKEAKENPQKKFVVNISLGSYGFNPLEYLLIRALHRQGVVIVAAAGNDNTSLKQFPAAYKETIAVAASEGNKKTKYSNYGEYVDITVSGFGEKEFLSRERKFEGTTEKTKTYYLIKAGTSFSTPRLSGLIAYILKQRPDLKPKDIIDKIKRGAVPLKDIYFHKKQLGAGELDFKGTLLELDPLYQKISSWGTGSMIFSFLIVLIGIILSEIKDQGAGWLLGFIAFFILVPLLLIGQEILISKLDLLSGKTATATALVLTSLLIVVNYYGEIYLEVERIEKEKEEIIRRRKEAFGADL